MSENNTFTNSSLSATNKAGNKLDAKYVGPLVGAVGVILLIIGIVIVQAIRGFRNKRRKVYNVTDNVLKKGIIGKKQVIESEFETAIQNDFAEDELVQASHYEHSSENLLTEDEGDYATFTSRPSITQDAVNELPGASKPLAAIGEATSYCKEASEDEMVAKKDISEEHFIPRANPLLRHFKKSNKIASLVENSSLTSSLTSGSTTEITDEELILIGTAIKSCPHFGRESSDYSTDLDRDEPSETVSYPALTQSAKTSSSFQLQEVSSASEISSAADNFYQFSAENMDDVPCTEAAAVNRKDLWVLEDVVSADVIIIDN